MYGLRGKSKRGTAIWDYGALAEAIASQLPRDLNFDGNVFLMLAARFCVISFPGIYSGDFGNFKWKNNPNLSCACVFQADGGTAQFIGPAMTSAKGEHFGDHCADKCWCVELHGAPVSVCVLVGG